MKLHHEFADAFPDLSIHWRGEACPAARLMVLNESLVDELGLDADWLRSDEGIGMLTGTRLPADAQPVAQAYAGHQFGGFSPQLGDGRALLVGELRTPAGRLVDVHLKGSGRTPFARGNADGRATLGPMLRELIVSEAMHALGVPSSRSLAVLTTGRQVFRHGREPGAVLARVASSHLRVGSFQFAAMRGKTELLERLATSAISRHFPRLQWAEHPALALLEAVISTQAQTVARWMLVGFVHGVMNTDNMTISGETIDYGPCAFLEAYDPAAVFSSIDTQGRYAFGRQPLMGEWNLTRFAETLLPLIDNDQERAIERAENALRDFMPAYREAWSAGMRDKLGLPADAVTEPLAEELLGLMDAHRLDFTGMFRALADAARGNTVPLARLNATGPLADWLPRWLELRPDAELMDRVNPVYIPRNHLVEEALGEAVAGDAGMLGDLLQAVTSPYVERPEWQRFAQPAPEDFNRHFRTFCGT